jgi:hypothetical protein
MSKLTNELREAQIINTGDFYAEKGQVYIGYTPAETGRASRSACWRVYRTGYKTDPEGAWYDYGNKTFLVWAKYGEKHSEVKKRVLAEAQEWAEKRYGITEWKRDPFGSYGDAIYVKARLKALKAKIKALPFRVGDSVLINGEGEPRIVDNILREERIHLEGDPTGYRAIYYKPSELTKIAS